MLARLARVGGRVAPGLAPGSAGGGSPAARPLCELSFGPPATSVALSGELMAVSRPWGERRRTNGGGGPAHAAALGLLSFVLCSAAGCTWDRWNIFVPAAPPGPADSLVLRGDTLEPETTAATGKTATELAGARELYRRGEYKDASKLFHRV